ncbi:hypothetical protein Tco_0145580 [Tanacetum coccineum]
MASLDYRLNHTFKECSSCGALYTKDHCCSKGGLVDKFVRDPNNIPDSSQRPPHDCPKCGNPVDGLYYRGCALLRKKLKEFLFTICKENEIFQDFLNTSESSNDDTNVVNMFQEPFVFNQDLGENSSQSPPHIHHHCCYECEEPMDGFFCQQCTSKSCGNGAHYGFNCWQRFWMVGWCRMWICVVNYILSCGGGGLMIIFNTSSTEISVVKQKYDELLKKSLLTRSQFEGQLKEKTKVISDLKVKEGKDIDTMIEMEKQIKFLNEILYKRNQSIQTIHMLAPKCATYNGRSTFANPKYLKKAQSDKPRLYEIPYDTSDPANRFCPDGGGTWDS